MRRFFFITLALIAAVSSCSIKEETAQEMPEIRFFARMETDLIGPETKAYADEDLHIFWNRGDLASIFYDKTYNRAFHYLGRDGTTAGEFGRYGTDPSHFTEQEISTGYDYAIFPYDYDNACDTEGNLTVVFPYEQNRSTNGIGVNLVLVARDPAGDFMFKHAAGYLGIALYGSGVTVSKITLTGNNNEYLSGYPSVFFSEEDEPYVSFLGAVDDSKSVTLVCDPPVELGASSSESTMFWITLPPTVFAKGITMTITDPNGNTCTKKRSSSLVIDRKSFKSLKAAEVVIEGGDTPSVINVSSVQLNESAMSLSVGETGNLTATVNPSDATDKTVTWTSSNTAVATVDANGKVTAVAPGTAVIVVTTTDGGKTASCTVTVTSTTIAVESVSLDKTSISLAEGETATIIATVSPDNATNKAVNWTSSSPEVATVDANGNVTAVAAGTTVIIASTADGGKTAFCTITVTASVVAVESVSLNKSTLSLEEGATETLTATVNPSNATNKNVTWSSSNAAVATVDANGMVTAVAAGTAVIIVTTEDGGKTATCAVTVTASAVAVESVSLNKTELSLIVGAEETLTATVLPENADNKAVTWSSSDESVATVDANGKVKAIAIGEAVITVTTADGGKTATCTVTVTKNPNQPGDPIVIEPEEEL